MLLNIFQCTGWAPTNKYPAQNVDSAWKTLFSLFLYDQCIYCNIMRWVSGRSVATNSIFFLGMLSGIEQVINKSKNLKQLEVMGSKAKINLWAEDCDQWCKVIIMHRCSLQLEEEKGGMCKPKLDNPGLSPTLAFLNPIYNHIHNLISVTKRFNSYWGVEI